ncbi:MAG: hypothetical protein Q8N34_03155 [Gammaproteobacteria bacterium]|nr:hypothetical protein [Gammaproteobacteria bacterium]
MARALSFLDGSMGGVNTVLNVIGMKEDMKDRKSQRDRQLKLDNYYEEDRAEAKGDRETARTRQLKLDTHYDEDRVANREDRERANYWTEVLNEQSARLGNMNIDNAEYAAARRPIVDAQADVTHQQSRILNDLNIRSAQGAERNRVLENSYNLLRGFNGFVDGQDVDEKPVMDALNYFLQKRINNDPATANKSISNIMPAPNGQGVLVELNVEPKDGKPYQAPLTRNRSSDPNDPVVVVPYDDLFSLVNEVADDLQEAGFQGSLPEITRQLEEFMRVASGDRTVEEAATALAKSEREHAQQIDLKNLESQNRMAEATHDASLGGGRNQTINTIEYFRRNMVGPDGQPIPIEQAIEIANMSKSDPSAAVIRVYQQLSDSQANSTLPGSSNVRASEEELMTQAQQMVQNLRREVLPTSGVRSAGPRQLVPPPAAAQAGSIDPEQSMLDELPDAALHPGVIATNEETGEQFESNGIEWVPIQ